MTENDPFSWATGSTSRRSGLMLGDHVEGRQGEPGECPPRPARLALSVLAGLVSSPRTAAARNSVGCRLDPCRCQTQRRHGTAVRPPPDGHSSVCRARARGTHTGDAFTPARRGGTTARTSVPHCVRCGWHAMVWSLDPRRGVRRGTGGLDPRRHLHQGRDGCRRGTSRWGGRHACGERWAGGARAHARTRTRTHTHAHDPNDDRLGRVRGPPSDGRWARGWGWGYPMTASSVLTGGREGQGNS